MDGLHAPRVLGGGQPALLIALIWAGHIGADRLLGYGLKFESGFTNTHLSTQPDPIAAISRGVDGFLVPRITHPASRFLVASFRTSLFYSMDTDCRLPSDSRTGHTSYRYAPSFDCSRRPGPGPAPFEISTWLLPHLI